MVPSNALVEFDPASAALRPHLRTAYLRLFVAQRADRRAYCGIGAASLAVGRRRVTIGFMSFVDPNASPDAVRLPSVRFLAKAAIDRLRARIKVSSAYYWQLEQWLSDTFPAHQRDTATSRVIKAARDAWRAVNSLGTWTAVAVDPLLAGGRTANDRVEVEAGDAAVWLGNGI